MSDAAVIDATLIGAVRRIAQAAAQEIRRIYDDGSVAALALRAKADTSPLTAADLAAHRCIVDGLHTLTPSWPILSEEAAEVPFETRRHWQRFWLVDPLDGTREFLSRNGEFTVNIALIEHGRPVFGLVHLPVDGRQYWGVPGRGAWRAHTEDDSGTPIRVASYAAAPVRVVGSRSHRGDSLDAFLARLGPHELVALGSSLKLCVLAEGEADVYPRLGPTSEWDIAAGHAVLAGAGGQLWRTDGSAFRYNDKPDWLNPAFVAFGPADRRWLALLAEGAAP